jgi:hypothetical protein
MAGDEKDAAISPAHESIRHIALRLNRRPQGGRALLEMSCRSPYHPSKGLREGIMM